MPVVMLMIVDLPLPDDRDHPTGRDRQVDSAQRRVLELAAAVHLFDPGELDLHRGLRTYFGRSSQVRSQVNAPR